MTQDWRSVRGEAASLVILGTSAHSKVVGDIASQSGYRVLGYIGDGEALELCDTDKALNGVKTFGELVAKEPETMLALGIGDNKLREKLFLRYSADFPRVNWPVLVDPSALLKPGVKLGQGTVVCPLAFVGLDTLVGVGCLLNTRSSVDHDSELGDFCSMAPSSATGGTVSIGKRSFVGVGVSIRDGIRIGDDVIVGAGAAVVKDLDQAGTYVGVPAKSMRREKEV